jgi:hypothetical protein
MTLGHRDRCEDPRMRSDIDIELQWPGEYRANDAVQLTLRVTLGPQGSETEEGRFNLYVDELEPLIELLRATIDAAHENGTLALAKPGEVE